MLVHFPLLQRKTGQRQCFNQSINHYKTCSMILLDTSQYKRFIYYLYNSIYIYMIKSTTGPPRLQVQTPNPPTPPTTAVPHPSHPFPVGRSCGDSPHGLGRLGTLGQKLRVARCWFVQRDGMGVGGGIGRMPVRGKDMPWKPSPFWK